MKRRSSILISILALWFAGLALHAQTTDPLVYTVGKVFTDSGNGKPIAYILWQPGDPSSTFGKHFAIYRKEGLPSSPLPYERIGRTQIQTSPAATHALLKLGGRFDYHAGDVADRINTLYAEMTSQPDAVPAHVEVPGLPEAKRLSYLLNIAANDIKVMQRLFFLGRAHPGVYMALGHGFALQVPVASKDTYEVREVDAAGNDIRVIGRVSLVQSFPTVLAPTSRPYEVFHTPKSAHQEVASPLDHLVTRLRWGMSDAHRRLFPHMFGYDLYRVKRNVAVANGWNAAPPTLAALEAVLATSAGNANPDAKRVNSLPIMAGAIMSEGEAADTATDNETVFFHDDNDPPLNPFKNGDRFYYYIAPLDIAGHPGPLSPGTEVVICDRLPPTVPMIESVRSIFESDGNANNLTQMKGNQHFRIRIRQTPDLPVEDAATRYKIYRWSNHTQHIEKGGDPAAHLVGVVNHVPGQAYVDWDDIGAGSPKITPADTSEFGKTWWFTVRAEDNAACNPKNLSGHSPPQFGVLRDRTGPNRPTGYITICRFTPHVNCDKPKFYELKKDLGLDPAFQGFVVRYKRLQKQIRGFDIKIVDPDATGEPPAFQASRTFSYLDTKDLVIPPIDTTGKGYYIYSRARMASGLVSRWVSCPLDGIQASSEQVRVIPIDLWVNEQCYPAPSGGGITAPPHDAFGLNGQIVGPQVTATLPVGTAEYRIYRRVGQNGSYEMLQRGAADGLPNPLPGDVTFTDPAPPTAGGTTVCYFIQVFDENGNPGARVKIGCLTIVSGDLGTPIVSDPEFLEESGGLARVRLRWFCDPVGVERFEIWAASENDSDPGLTSPLIGPKGASIASAAINEALPNLLFSSYQTKSITSGLVGTGAEFSVVLNVPATKKITYVVRAVGKGAEDTPGSGTYSRGEGPYSNAVSGQWTAPAPGKPSVIPWPSLGVIGADPISRNITDYPKGEGPLYGMPLPAGDSHSAAVLVGIFNGINEDSPKDVQIPSDIDPLSLFFDLNNPDPEATELEKLVPFVVYRHQLPNAAHPNAVPNLIQVSPLIDRMAYQLRSLNGTNVKFLKDPFFRYIPYRASEATTIYKVPIGGQLTRDGSQLMVGPASQNVAAVPYLQSGGTMLWWHDPMPVVKGARYQYLIVHFTKRGEISRVIPTNYVDQP